METPTDDPTQVESAPNAASAYPPELLAVLGVPADQVTPESVQNAAAALAEKAAKADELAATLADVQGKLGTLEAEAQTRLAAELDAELAGYDLDEETLGVVKTLSPEQRKPLLGKLPKKTPVGEANPKLQKTAGEGNPKSEIPNPKSDVPPPVPVHNPKAEGGGDSEADIVNAIKTRVAELQKADPRASYSALWTKAETEVRAKAANGQPLV